MRRATRPDATPHDAAAAMRPARVSRACHGHAGRAACDASATDAKRAAPGDGARGEAGSANCRHPPRADPSADAPPRTDAGSLDIAGRHGSALGTPAPSLQASCAPNRAAGLPRMEYDRTGRTAAARGRRFRSAAIRTAAPRRPHAGGRRDPTHQAACPPANRPGIMYGSRRGVAQPGRALRSGRRSRRFESCLPDQLNQCFSESRPPRRLFRVCAFESAVALLRLLRDARVATPVRPRMPACLFRPAPATVGHAPPARATPRRSSLGRCWHPWRIEEETGMGTPTELGPRTGLFWVLTGVYAAAVVVGAG